MKDKHWIPSKLLKSNSRNIYSPDPSIAKTFLREISKNTPENEISTDSDTVFTFSKVALTMFGMQKVGREKSED